jgi:hypothetical protein
MSKRSRGQVGLFVFAPNAPSMALTMGIPCPSVACKQIDQPDLVNSY